MSESLVERELLIKYMNEFWGYGNLEGKIWFIGIEEGIDSKLKKDEEVINELRARIKAWKSRGFKTPEDVYDYHIELGRTKMFDGDKLQKTWSGLIRIYCAATRDNKKVLNKEVLKLQKEKLARLNSDHCLLELLPLPKSSKDSWPYATLSQIEGFDYLQSLKKYENEIKQKRISMLRNKIAEKNPDVVILYIKDKDTFSKLCNISKNEVKVINTGVLAKKNNYEIFMHRSGQTMYLCIQHPGAGRQNYPNELWESIGTYINKNVPNLKKIHSN